RGAAGAPSRTKVEQHVNDRRTELVDEVRDKASRQRRGARGDRAGAAVMALRSEPHFSRPQERPQTISSGGGHAQVEFSPTKENHEIRESVNNATMHRQGLVDPVVRPQRRLSPPTANRGGIKTNGDRVQGLLLQIPGPSFRPELSTVDF